MSLFLQLTQMEDAHVVSDPFDEDPMEGFYAVYDGHGGESAAKFVEQHLHKVCDIPTKSNTDLCQGDETREAITAGGVQNDYAAH